MPPGHGHVEHWGVMGGLHQPNLQYKSPKFNHFRYMSTCGAGFWAINCWAYKLEWTTIRLIKSSEKKNLKSNSLNPTMLNCTPELPENSGTCVILTGCLRTWELRQGQSWVASSGVHQSRQRMTEVKYFSSSLVDSILGTRKEYASLMEYSLWDIFIMCFNMCGVSSTDNYYP